MGTAERIVLEHNQARVEGGDGAEIVSGLNDFIRGINRSSVRGFDEQPLPKNNLAWKIDVGDFTLCLLEQDPALHRLLWLDPKSQDDLGPDAVYAPRNLATPYVVIKVVFRGGLILPRAELFYRNAPLTHLDDELFWPNLLNVSPHSYQCTAWICTQYLHHEGIQPGVASGLHALLKHLWGGGFNRSSELHEGASGFSKACQDKVDKRITDVERWEAESIKDPRFVLGVNWKPTGLTVRKLIENELQINRVVRDLGNTGELVNILMSSPSGNGKQKK